ncbi:DUF4209 domain-containing protein [Thermodesulfobacteriota bacterium]
MDTNKLEEIKDSVQNEEYDEGLLTAASAFERLRDEAVELGLDEEVWAAKAEIEIFNFMTATPFVGQDYDERLIPLRTSPDKSEKWPDVESFDEKRLKYYEDRMEKTTNPYLKARYADVLFEAWNQCLAKNKREIGEVLTDSLLSLGMARIKKEPRPYLEIVQDYARVIDVSIKVGLRDRLTETAKRLISILKDLQGSDILYVYHVSAIMRGVAGSRLRTEVGEDQYATCADHVDKARSFYWDAKDYLWHREFCKELVVWGKLLGWDETKIKSKSIEIGKSFEAEAEYKGSKLKSQMLKARCLERATQHYMNIGETDGLDSLKIAIADAYEALGNGQELSSVPIELRIPEEVLENFLNIYRHISIDVAVERVATDPNLVVDLAASRQTTNKHAASSPVIAMASKFIFDKDRKVFSADTDEESMKMLVDRDYYLGVAFLNEFLLKNVFQVLREEKGLSPNDLIGFLEKWHLWDKEKTPFVRVAIERYFEFDYVSALHILVPQLEDCVRKAFAKAGYATTTIQKGTTQHEQTFTEFLKRTDIRGAIPENFHKYLEMALVEQTGFNLRNDVAHGLIKQQDCNENNTLMVIHLYLILATCRIIPPSE